MNKKAIILLKELAIGCLLAIAGFAVSFWFVTFMGNATANQREVSKMEISREQFPLKLTDATVESNGQVESKCTGASEQLNQQFLIRVSISPESRVKASAMNSSPKLTHEEWNEFVIEIENAAGVRSHLRVESDQFLKDGKVDVDKVDVGTEDVDRWLIAEMVSDKRLSGELLEYRTMRLWSRDIGKRAVVLAFNVGQGTQDLGFRSDVLLVFDVK